MHSVPLEYDSTETKRPGGYAWLVVGLLCVVALLNYLDRLMITTMRDSIRADLHVSDAQFGLFTSIFLWSYACCSPAGGFMADRFGRRRVILGSLIFWSIATVATAMARNVEQMLAARVLMGVSEACYIPAALALIADYHRGPTRSLATGLHMVGLYAGMALGGLGGYLAEAKGWRFGFQLFGGIGIAYGIILMFVLRDAPAVARSGATAPARLGLSETLGKLFSVTGFYVMLAVNVLVGIINWGVNGWMPTFFKAQHSLDSGKAGLISTMYVQVAALAGVLVAAVIADHWSRSNPRARNLVPAVGYLVAAPFVFLLATTHNMPLAIMGLIVFGIGRGGFDANQMPIVRELVDDRCSATAYGMLNFIGTITGGLMVYAGGKMLDKGVPLTAVFEFVAGCLLVVSVLLFFLPRRKVVPPSQGFPAVPINSESLGLTTSDAALAATRDVD